MTPEYSRFLLGMVILAVSAIAVVGWLYIATKGEDELDESDDEELALAKKFIEGCSDEQVDKLFDGLLDALVANAGLPESDLDSEQE